MLGCSTKLIQPYDLRCKRQRGTDDRGPQPGLAREKGQTIRRKGGQGAGRGHNVFLQAACALSALTFFWLPCAWLELAFFRSMAPAWWTAISSLHFKAGARKPNSLQSQILQARTPYSYATQMSQIEMTKSGLSAKRLVRRFESRKGTMHAKNRRSSRRMRSFVHIPIARPN